MVVDRVTVNFKGTIPTQPYGGVAVEVVWGATIGEDESPEDVTRELFKRIREEVTLAVTPIAKAKLASAQQVLKSLPYNEREQFMQQFGVVQWLQTVVPEAYFAAEDNGNTGLEETVADELASSDGDDSAAPDEPPVPVRPPRSRQTTADSGRARSAK